MLKGELKGWRLNTFSDLDRSMEEKKGELERLDIIDDTLGLDEEEARNKELIMENLMKESSWRETQLFQKLRNKWITEGDLNFSFFHGWINTRNKKNEIQGLRANGRWLDSVAEVKSEIFHHFKRHFDTQTLHRPSLPPDLFTRKLESVDNDFLTVEFTKDEI